MPRNAGWTPMDVGRRPANQSLEVEATRRCAKTSCLPPVCDHNCPGRPTWLGLRQWLHVGFWTLVLWRSNSIWFHYGFMELMARWITWKWPKASKRWQMEMRPLASPVSAQHLPQLGRRVSPTSLGSCNHIWCLRRCARGKLPNQRRQKQSAGSKTSAVSAALDHFRDNNTSFACCLAHPLVAGKSNQ